MFGHGGGRIGGVGRLRVSEVRSVQLVRLLVVLEGRAEKDLKRRAALVVAGEHRVAIGVNKHAHRAYLHAALLVAAAARSQPGRDGQSDGVVRVLGGAWLEQQRQRQQAIGCVQRQPAVYFRFLVVNF